MRIESGPAYQTVKNFSPTLDWLKLTGASEGRYVPAASSSPCGGLIIELGASAVAIEHEVVLQQHVPDRNPVLRDDRQVAVGAADREQADEPGVDMGCGQPMQMAVIPIRALRLIFGNVVGVGVRHAVGDVQQHIVGVPLRTDVKAVDVKVQRRGRQLLRVDRNVAARRGVLRAEEVPDGQAGQAVLEMDDQGLARRHLQGRRGIKIAARHPAVGRRAADHFIVEQQEVLHRCRHRVERGFALSRGEPDLENAVPARKGHRLAKLGSHREVGLALRERWRDAELRQRNQHCCAEGQLEAGFEKGRAAARRQADHERDSGTEKRMKGRDRAEANANR